MENIYYQTHNICLVLSSHSNECDLVGVEKQPLFIPQQNPRHVFLTYNLTIHIIFGIFHCPLQFLMR